MAELVEVTMRSQEHPSGLHTALVADHSESGLLLTIPATNGEVIVRLNSADVTDLLNLVQGGKSDPRRPYEVEAEQLEELDAMD
jgi:hypothetical protein